MARCALALLVGVGLLVAVACGGAGVPERVEDDPLVGDRVVATVDVVPGDGLAFTNVGQRAAVSVVVANDAGALLNDVAVSWSSSGGVVSVDAAGVVVAEAEGAGTVRAEAGGVSATIDVVVSRPVPRGVRVDVPVLVGSDIEVVSDYGSAPARVTRAGVDGDVSVLVSPVRHSLVRVRDGEGRLFLAVSSVGAGAERAAVEPLVVDHRSTARALLLTHPFLFTSERAMAEVIETVLVDHPALDALAGVVAAFGGVHQSVMQEPAMRRVLLDSVLSVVEAVVDALEGIAGDDDESLDVLGSWGEASITSSGAAVPFDVSNSSFSMSWSSDRLYPRLSTEGMGMGVGYRFRHLPIDSSGFTSVFDIREAALAFSEGRSHGGRTSFDFLPAGDRPSTAFVGPTSWFKNLMITEWLARGMKELMGVEGPRLGTSADQVYLVVGVTPGFGLFDSAQTSTDRAWMRSIPEVEADMRQVRALNAVTLALAGINNLVDLGNVSLDQSATMLLNAFTCAMSVLPDVMSDGTDLEAVGGSLAACVIAALLDAGFDDVADVAGIAQESAGQLYQVVAEIGRGLSASSAGMVQPLAEPVSTAVVLKLVLAAQKVGSAGSAVHQLYDTLRLSPMQVAVFVRGTPTLRGPEPERRPPQAQLFVRPSNQVIVEERVTFDARGSVDADGGGIVEYRFEGPGESTTRSDGVWPVRFHRSGTHEVCVRVVNRDGEVSERACERVSVLDAERAVEALPDLIVYDYRLSGLLQGDANFLTHLIDHDEELPLTILVRNAGSVNTPAASSPRVGVYRDGQLISSREYGNSADANYGGQDLDFVLNTSRNRIPPGEHTITMWVDYEGVVRERDVTNNTRSFHLTVLPPDNLPPSADFAFSVDGLQATFSDRSTDPDGSRDLHRWSWAFGDGSTSSERNPVHTYRDAGAYDVTLEVRDRGGLSDSRTRRVVVEDPNRRPTAGFSFDVEGLTVVFTNSSTDPDGDDDLVAWWWDFGDDSVSAERNPVHTYASSGTYSVTLTAFDAAGASDSITRDVSVTFVGEAPEISTFAANPSTVGIDEVAILSWSVSGSEPMSLSISPDVGDVSGLTSVGVSPSETTNYTLTASNEAGTDTATTTVSVTEAPVVSVTLEPSSVTLPVNGTQEFTATVMGTSDTSVTWSATCGSISGSGNTITFNAPTTVPDGDACIVRATSTADDSAWADATATVVQPTITVSVEPESVTLPASATHTFTATVTGTSNTSVTWNATCGTISGTGTTITYTAPVAESTCEIGVTSVAHPTAHAAAAITVTAAPEPMVLMIDTTLGVGTSFTIPLRGDVDVAIDWGDDHSTAATTSGDVTHEYASEGHYTIRIDGTLTGYGAGVALGSHDSGAGVDMLVGVQSWGDLGLTSLSAAFQHASNLSVVPETLPPTVTNTSLMFRKASTFNHPIGVWDTRNVVNMQGMFDSAVGFDQNIATWDTSNVTNMAAMFRDATTFNQPIGTWDTSNVTNMSAIFLSASEFNAPIGSWDTSKVTSLRNAFYGATAFNQPLGNWDTSNVTDMTQMFALAISFNQPIGTWNTGNVLTMSSMFADASAFNQPLDAWDTSNVTDMSRLFFRALAFNQPIGDWDTSSVTNMWGVFYGATTFNQHLESWNLGNVEDTGAMFLGASVFNQPIAAWDTSSVAAMNSMFWGATAFNQSLDAWDTSSVTNMSAMFYLAANFNQPLNTWNTSRVTDMSYLFGWSAAFDQPLNDWNTSNVANMSHMFVEARSFNQDLSAWCVALIPSEPTHFALSATAWTLPMPVWGTCPG